MNKPTPRFADASRALAFDREHIWHPYTSLLDPPPVFAVTAAAGVRLRLADGREIIDAMSSWWSAIHGYQHPRLVAAMQEQIDTLSHVMFGGLTHEPAIELAARLVEITPAPLDKVFFSDSGSVSVEVAIKLALQYWAARGATAKQKLLTIRGGYHGDTFGAMAVCDPVTGMHGLFSDNLSPHLFAPRPAIRFDEAWDDDDFAEFERLLRRHRDEVAAVILEPIVQGAGGMWFYHPEYLRRARALCDELDTLLIFDEIATGFGRTGKLFAGEHAAVAPDILCVGKALTGGMLSLAATLTSAHIGHTISRGEPGVFMHGPTYMANPLACATACASLDLLLDTPWQARVRAIEQGLCAGLNECSDLPAVNAVRVLGAIGVVELHEPVDMRTIPHEFVSRGVWVRPFGRLVYVMPPYVISEQDLACVTRAIVEVVAKLA